MRSFLLAMAFGSLFITGCEKEANRKLLNAYFRYETNGTKIDISEGIIINENLFECKFKGDTAVQILASKVYDGAGIYIKDLTGIKDGTYVLNNQNLAFYLNPPDQKRYTTSDKFTGSVTIKKSTFQAKTLLNTLEGTFHFSSVDSITGKSFVITNGSFLMERQ